MTLVVCTLLLGLYSASALVVGRVPHQRRSAPLRSSVHMLQETTALAKIVATIGPASEEQDILSKCVKAGLGVMRCNFSHATPEEFFLRVGNLRKAPGGDRCALMLDTKASPTDLVDVASRPSSAQPTDRAQPVVRLFLAGPGDPYGWPQGVQGDGQP